MGGQMSQNAIIIAADFQRMCTMSYL